MELTVKDRAQLMVDACLRSKINDPMQLFFEIAGEDFVRIHGPEHHFLDGAVLLTSFKNAGGDIDLASALEELMSRSLQMPGAICGNWAVCGAVASVGAALSIIEGTGPLASDGSWGEHMQVSAAALLRIANTKGPRCCKRDGFIALCEGVKYLNAKYAVAIPETEPVCTFSAQNKQCIKSACPYYPER